MKTKAKIYRSIKWYTSSQTDYEKGGKGKITNIKNASSDNATDNTDIKMIIKASSFWSSV